MQSGDDVERKLEALICWSPLSGGCAHHLQTDRQTDGHTDGQTPARHSIQPLYLADVCLCVFV